MCQVVYLLHNYDYFCGHCTFHVDHFSLNMTLGHRRSPGLPFPIRYYHEALRLIMHIHVPAGIPFEQSLLMQLGVVKKTRYGADSCLSQQLGQGREGT